LDIRKKKISNKVFCSIQKVFKGQVLLDRPQMRKSMNTVRKIRRWIRTQKKALEENYMIND
jgi:hypothetical protein